MSERVCGCDSYTGSERDGLGRKRCERCGGLLDQSDASPGSCAGSGGVDERRGAGGSSGFTPPVGTASTEASGRALPVQSFILETSAGGVDVTVCGCGVVLLRSQLAWDHIDSCPSVPAIEARLPIKDKETETP